MVDGCLPYWLLSSW